MAKASMKAREERRRRTVLKYAVKRAELKEIIRSPKFSQEEKEAAQIKLQKLPRTPVQSACKEDAPLQEDLTLYIENLV